ncbi:MAG: methylmalonyl-CoA mutase [Chloroflexota bacterium]|nr:MAG: methylmalonyl-CoA mutase [Chloroflexota bacterium]
MAKRIRVLMAKTGLDGHELGAVVVARGLRDAGMEVIYTGMHRLPEEIAETALQEDVQVVGVSIYCGTHVSLMAKVIAELKRQKIFGACLLLVGGPIPLGDARKLKEMGVDEVFSSRASIDSIVGYIKERVPAMNSPLQEVSRDRTGG